jgi:anti-sigma regulatory factor (Ser/Thr protein kinase)
VTTTVESRPLTSDLDHREGHSWDGSPSCSASSPVRCLLPATTAAPGLARQFLLREACRDHLADPGDALLLASELVTNALLHGEPPIELAMRCAGSRTIVSVTDVGEPPTLRRSLGTADALSGRGLRLLDALAADWGIDNHTHGKTFWFVLAQA